MPTTTAPIVVADDLHKAYGETRALSGVTLEARAGEIHALVGENGSGKSTLVKVLSGVLGPDRGTVRIGGAVPVATTPRAFGALGVATVFQEVLMVDAGTVADNVFLGHDGLFRARTSRAERRARTADLLGRLTGRAVDPDAPVESLSLSSRQWVAIARALVREPRVLILDESTAALDLEDAGALSRELVRLRDAGTCVLLVTHRIRELQELADRATVLRGGVAAATISGAEVTEGRLLELMRGEPAAAVDAEAAALHRRGGHAGGAVIRARGLRLAPAAVPFDFEVRAGEVVGLAGLEGHGQRELIEVLAGVGRPAEGTAEAVEGGAYADARTAARRGVAYVPGDRKREGLFPHLGIDENFGLPTYAQDAVAGGVVRRPSLLRRFAEQAERFAIRFGRPRDAITTLSGGNQQKVLVARWVAARPRVLLLNDPTRGVDFQTKHDLYRLLREIAEEGVGVVFLTTEIDELRHVCDRVVVFRNRSAETELAADDVTGDRVLAALFGTREAPPPMAVAALEEVAR